MAAKTRLFCYLQLTNYTTNEPTKQLNNKQIEQQTKQATNTVTN
jgi:hypothetical protein